MTEHSMEMLRAKNIDTPSTSFRNKKWVYATKTRAQKLTSIQNIKARWSTENALSSNPCNQTAGDIYGQLSGIIRLKNHYIDLVVWVWLTCRHIDTRLWFLTKKGERWVSRLNLKKNHKQKK